MITMWSRGQADHHMPESILAEFSTQVANHPWWQARANLILALLDQYDIQPPARILDAGSGWGQTFDILEARGFPVTGLDISRQALERLDRPGRTLIEADLTQPLSLDPEQRPKFDAILALDIIEHVDNPVVMLSNLSSLLEPAGRLIVNVPALPELFSEFDEANGHRLRYEPHTLKADLEAAHLHVDRLFSWSGWTLALFRLRRRGKMERGTESPLEIYRRHLKLPPWPFPWLFRKAYALEHARALRGKVKLGTSLMAVARRSTSVPLADPSSPSTGSGDKA
jgi:SAM-dependent methyltransferase